MKNHIKLNYKKNRGVALLFAIMVTGVLFAVALGTTNIALKETKFSTSSKSTNEAFFAADTGAECALFNDKNLLTFPLSGVSNITNGKINCTDVTGYFNQIDNGSFVFVVPSINSSGSCAIVTVLKTDSGTKDEFDNIIPSVEIISKGYNVGDDSCNSTNTNRVERELELNY